MSPYVKVTWGNNNASTLVAAGDMSPSWHETLVMEGDEALPVHLSVLHKAFLVGDVEIGACLISDLLETKGQ